MSLNYNGTNITAVNYNGTTVDKIVYNGTTVWERVQGWVNLNTSYSVPRSNNTGDGTYTLTINNAYIKAGAQVRIVSRGVIKQGTTSSYYWTQASTTSSPEQTTTFNGSESKNVTAWRSSAVTYSNPIAVTVTDGKLVINVTNNYYSTPHTYYSQDIYSVEVYV